MKVVRDVVHHSIEALLKEVIELTLDGFVVDPTNPGDTITPGQCFTVSMYRDDSTVARLKDISANIAEKPKLTRAEILAKARAAKRPKAEPTLNVDEVITS